MATRPGHSRRNCAEQEARTRPASPGALCLELLATGGHSGCPRYEVPHTPADPVRWAGVSRLRLGPDLSVSGGELARAHELRASLRRLATARTHGTTPDAADFEVVNVVAAEPPLVPRIAVGAGKEWASGATGSALLSTVARDAMEFFVGPYARRIRECGAHDCQLLFVDTSRPGRWRWCVMGRRREVPSRRSASGDNSPHCPRRPEQASRDQPARQQPVHTVRQDLDGSDPYSPGPRRRPPGRPAHRLRQLRRAQQSR
ncbi:CGNR zinc finger domain-containing protein [Streptomyces sp. NPDC002205]|uniref:CGNR zinc finger domain-containing protein n=1 Tax=Streptomyces sp. NPDC002205 TaxID=3154411 RepID=UPI00331B79F5